MPIAIPQTHAAPARLACLLRHALDVGQQAMFSALDQYTLADVVQNPTGNAIVSMHRLYLAQTPDKPGQLK